MERLYWESISFAPGVHTHHAWAEEGEHFARDMRNLRADENAYLRLRQATDTVSGVVPSAAVTGIHATSTHLYYLQVDGQLFVLDKDDVFTEFLDLADLKGRLWIVDAFRDFVIGKTEGDEKGFWSDLRDPHDYGTGDTGDFGTTVDGDFAVTGGEFPVFPLGLEPPALPVLGGRTSSTDGLETGIYVYALTAVRAFWSDLDNVDLPPQVANKSLSGHALMNGMESNPRYFVVKVGGAQGDVYAGDVLIEDVISIPAGQGVHLSNVTFPDAQQTGIYVYRTERLSVGTRGRREDIEALEFRVTDFLFKERPSDGEMDTEGLLHLGVDISERPRMRTDNHRLPAGPAQITYFNDLIFAAVGDELRYSDVRDGAPVQWAWPEANSVRAAGDILFCVEWRGVLLFGGPQGVWRFTGTDEFNFERDQISGIGPVSRGAWGLFENGVGFVGREGFYLTNGVEVSKVSSPYLDSYFEASRARDGAVVLFPNEDELWSVTLENGGNFQFLRSHRGGFFPWHDAAAKQFAVEDEVMFADGVQSAVRTIDFSARVDASLPWFWFSQEIDFKEEGFAEALKTFKWLEVSSSHSGDGTLQVIVDGIVEDRLRPFKFRGDAQRPVRIPIKRRGERIQFRVSGTGHVVLRSLRLFAETRSSRRRF